MEHKDFRMALWISLFSYLNQAFSERKLAQPIQPTIPGLKHMWQPRERSTCYNCSLVYRSTKKRKFGEEIASNGAVRNRAARTYWGCSACKVAICTESSCWDDYHQKHTPDWISGLKPEVVRMNQAT